VLRPGGPLAAFWHVFDPPPEVAEAVAVVYQRLVPDAAAGAWPVGKPAGATRGPLGGAVI
jgi:hypothetical protein